MSHPVVSRPRGFPSGRQGGLLGERLDSWKDIATYLGREVRTVQRWALSRRLPVHRIPGGRRPRVFSTTAEIDAWIRAGAHQEPDDGVSVAVLRFLNLGGREEDQYFGDGLADDIIDALVRIPGLRVIARTSSFAFASKEDDVRHIGARLDAAWLLEGSIRRDGQRVRVSAQLVSGRDGVHAWSQSYDRQLTDLFAIQDEIARSIARELKLKLAPRPLATRTTENAEAYDLWVKGRSISQQYTPEALARAKECYEAAIVRDPGFSRPYFGIADLQFYAAQFGLSPPPDALPVARQAVVKSLELDDQFGEAHALLGTLQGMLDYDWAGAEASFEQALRLSPGSARILSEHAWYHLTPRLQLERAVDEAQQAVMLDPLSPRAHGTLGLVFVVARQYGRAVEECRTAVQLAPGLWWLHWFYGTALVAHGRIVLGLREFQGVYDEIHDPLVVGLMAGLYGMFLRRKKAKTLLAELREISRTTYVPPFAMAFAYLGLGDDRVFEWLDKAIDARDPVVTHLPSMPLYDGIRNDPRFGALLRRMNLGTGS
jgi:serine/threonine-protein kinase